MEVKPEVKEAKDARPLKNVRGEIVFESVIFGYQPGRPEKNKPQDKGWREGCHRGSYRLR